MAYAPKRFIVDIGLRQHLVVWVHLFESDGSLKIFSCLNNILSSFVLWIGGILKEEKVRFWVAI